MKKNLLIKLLTIIYNQYIQNKISYEELSNLITYHIKAIKLYITNIKNFKINYKYYKPITIV